jgi:Kef-type K+ transport system membrane component KefB
VNGSGHGTLPHVLLAMIVVIIAARLLGAVFRRLAQPAVIGEVVAGILLGPSLLGRVAPEVSTYLLPPSVAPYLQIIAQLGVILFMFLVGLELDTSLLRKRTRATVAISHASIVLPMALGAGSAMFIHRELAPAGVPLHVFALFLGVSMSVTAFPVLARILTDRGISKTELGTLAISCAAVDDVTAWCLLAGVVGFARHDFGDALRTLALSALYVTVMLVVVRPLLARLVRRQELLGRLTPGAVALVFIGLLTSALATEYAGIHALFGAFLLGAIIPHESLLAKDLKVKLEDLVVMLLLPAFFAYTGMRTQIGLLSDVWSWLVCAALIAVACAGKFGGGTLAARLTGLSWRDAASIGVLMNTRGLMELVVLNIGLDLGVISPALFAMLVVMAIVTTLATTPLLELLTRGGTGGVGARSVPSP